MKGMTESCSNLRSSCGASLSKAFQLSHCWSGRHRCGDGQRTRLSFPPLRSRQPVPRTSLLVRDCEHDDAVGLDEIREREREAGQENAADLEFGGRTRPAWPSRWALSDDLERALDLLDEVESETGPPALVPIPGSGQIGNRCQMKNDVHPLRFRQRPSRRWRTAAQSASSAVPASTSRARLSTSESQAAAASGSSDSSRLCSSSCARFARSRAGSESAAENNFLLVFEGIESSIHRGSRSASDTPQLRRRLFSIARMRSKRRWLM